MVRESLWHHFSSPQFWAPTGHVLSHYLPVVQFEKIGMEAVQTAWLLQLALLTARRRKHNLTIYIYSHVVCRRWYGKGCCGRCCCSPCARDGWPYSCFESWKAGLETPAAANQSRSQGPGWFNFILVCHVCVGEAVLTFHRATCTFIFPISGFFWWSCIAPASHHLYFQSFCFSSAPGEKTTQSLEIGGQTEHPRPLVAPGLQNDPSAVAASSKLYVSLKHLWLLSPEESAAASSKLYVSLKHLRLLSLKESDRNVVKSHAAGYLTTAVPQGIKNTFLRALAPVFAVAPKNY